MPYLPEGQPRYTKPSRLVKVPVKPHYRIGTSTSVPLPLPRNSGYSYDVHPYRPRQAPTPHPMISNYHQAQEYLGPRLAKKLPGVSTYLGKRQQGAIAVKYHTTDVVTYYPNGDVVLDSGGWRTHTTKDRINEYGPKGFHLEQRKYEWYLVAHNTVRYSFHDGMTIHADGTVT